jgi:hypothetical protein
MDTQDFISKYPTLLHLTHADCWPSMKRHGILSTQELLRRWEITGADAETLLATRRDKAVVLDHPGQGVAIVRDQHPLSEKQLAPALTDGMTVPDWLRLLNSLVFFFPTEAALRSTYAAYKGEPAVVIKVRTRTLVQEHGDQVLLAGINTGNTKRRPAPRGRDTFLPIRRYDHSKRSVKEVAVRYDVPDLRDHLLSVELWTPDGDVTHIA